MLKTNAEKQSTRSCTYGEHSNDAIYRRVFKKHVGQNVKRRKF